MAESRRDTRQALIEAGWDALGELRWVDLFPSARSLSDRVGVSTGSFFHHFRSIDHYAEVLARASMERLRDDVGVVAELLHRLARGAAGFGSVRAAAEADWEMLSATPDNDNVYMLMWALRDRPLSGDTTRTGGDLLREFSGDLVAGSVRGWNELLPRLGLEPLPPFTTRDVALLLDAVANGLVIRGRIDPDAVRAGLFADTLITVGLALTRPIGSDAAAHDAEHELAASLPTLAPLVAGEADAVLDAAAALFARTDPELIPVDTLAAAAGVAASEIVARFGSMVGVATAVASRAVLALGVDDAAQPSDPVDHVEARLAALVEWTRSHPALAQVLLDARLRAARSSGPAAVPASPGQILVEPLQVLRQGGALRRHVDVGTLATTVADGAMLRVALHPTEPTDRVTRETLDLALHGALEPEAWPRGS